MTVPFTARLRTRGGAIRLGAPDAAVITLRVQMPEVWDTVRIEAPSETPVSEVKRAALEALYPKTVTPDDFVLKIRGWEVLDETASLATVGAVNGSIFLLTHRRRRPVH